MNVEIIDYIFVSLILMDGVWIGGGIIIIFFIVFGVIEIVMISFQIDLSYFGGNIVNYVEISDVINVFGLIDEDLNFDQDNINDVGGEFEFFVDNYINGDGMGVIGSGDVVGDEDDYDLVLIFVEVLVDFELDKLVDNVMFYVGSRVVFMIIVENKGLSIVIGVIIFDNFLVGYDDVQFILVDGDVLVLLIIGNIVWNFDGISVGEIVMFVFFVLVVDVVEIVYDNSVEVFSLD